MNGTGTAAESADAEDADSGRPGTPYGRDTLEAMITTHRRGVERFVRALGHDAATAEDVTQKSLIGVARFWKKKGALRNPEAWLFKLARLRAVDEFRALGRRPVPVPDDALVQLTAQRVLHLREFVPGLDGLFADGHILLALKSLPIRQQHVLAFRFGLDLDIAVVAELLGSSVTDVKNAQQRGLQRLRNSPYLTGARTTRPEVHQ